MFFTSTDKDVSKLNNATINNNAGITPYKTCQHVPTILVVDDNKDILYLISCILKKNGFNVHGFSDPIAALEHIRGGCKEGITVLSDVNMPSIKGPQLIEQIKELRPEMKVIMMSSDVTEKEDFGVTLSTEIKVDGFLQKPFSIDELLLKIKQSIK
jgi:DNA-binding NtrC family response regulator